MGIVTVPVWSLVPIGLLLITCITRLTTGLRAYWAKHQSPASAQIPCNIPYWIPWLGNQISYKEPPIKWLSHVSQNLECGIFIVTGWGQQYHIVISPSLKDGIVDKASTHLDNSSLIFSTLKHFLGDRGNTEILAKQSNAEFWTKYCTIFSALNTSPFLDKYIQTTSKALENQTWNLISGNDSWVDQEMWERNAQVRIMDDTQSSDTQLIAEADLHALLCEWVGHVVVAQLLGRAFVQENPTVVDDILMMDLHRSAFMSPLPTILLPGLMPGIYARERLIMAIQELHEAMIKTKKDRDPGTKYDDLGDVSDPIWEQLELLEHSGANSRTRAVSCLMMLWTIVMESTQLTFWCIYYLNSNKDVLAEVRQEVAPFVQLLFPPPTGLAISEAPRLRIDAKGLSAKAPHLKGVFYEVMRLESSPFIFSIVTNDFTVTESEKDAKMRSKQKPVTYSLRKGERILIPSRIHHLDPNHFVNPDQFQSKRFLPESVGSPETALGTLRPWDRGESIITCATVVQNQVLLLVAAFVSIWDMKPADNALFNAFQGWQHPGRILANGVCRPKKDIRVKIWRRKIHEQ